MDDYTLMMNGARPEGCICEMTEDVGRGPYGEPQEPAAWSLNPDCPLHGAADMTVQVTADADLTVELLVALEAEAKRFRSRRALSHESEAQR